MALAEINSDHIIITLPVEKVIPGIKEEAEELLNNLPIVVKPVQRLTTAQNGLIHVLLKQYGEELGWNMSDMKEYIKEQFSMVYDIENFSTARCDIGTANDFISYIIEHALKNEINLYIMNRNDKRYKHILEIDKTTERYVIACLRNRTCCICGKVHNEYHTVELHHYNSVASIGGYSQCDGLKTPFMTLCTEHHRKFHDIGREDFEKLYHISGSWLTPQIVYDVLGLYPNHFELFRKRLKEGYYQEIVKEEK